ncbi:MAG TPA: DUF1007 family protein [Hypericibacter adhaerens]|uniref:ABC transporter substrate-binding protein n=1 Tax=Hypericibacter adhaerens TaxID=2602016 RepID=A0A5J6N3S1_9PROT|nr:DUF1007 family protein [Hypericibacter adhaerens]QEX24459.1 hypothetical protein FRZ61_44000 [Hypericibacter adhaerens]HWA45735.1 DUF1007 family protein [Hypericibacter adhaerens]
MRRPLSAGPRRRRASALIFLFAFGLAGGLPSVASAHPHVFIDNRVTFLFKEGKIVGFRENWQFDEIFSEDLLGDFDKDGDGRFSKAESEAVAGVTLPALEEYHYFTYVWVDGKDLGKIKPTDFHASARDKLASYDFLIALPKPVDPLKQVLAVEIADRSYFVEVLLAKNDPVKIDGLKEFTCQPNVTMDKKNAYYGGYVIPQQIKLTCQ